MKYNPDLHNRHSIRLRGYDYASAGMYFVTICCQNQEHLFGKIIDGKMILNECGKIAMQCWQKIPRHFPNAILHEHVIMPNHIHCVIELTNAVGAKNLSPIRNERPQHRNERLQHGNACPTDHSFDSRQRAKNFSPLHQCGTSRTIGSVIRGFKIGVTKQLGHSIWQRNYYEHIIRSEPEHVKIAAYIRNNPILWEKDCFYNGDKAKLR